MVDVMDSNVRELSAPLGSELRPSWRGRTHMLTLIAAAPAFGVLIWLAHDAVSRVGVVIYAVGLCSMFAVSTTFHRWVHTVRARTLWQRADHATIFAAIAGTSTPICLVAMPRPWGIVLLIGLWTGAAAGALIKVFAFEWRHTAVLGNVLYLGLGWAGLAALPYLWSHSGMWTAICVLGGGVLYTIGAIGFAMSRPRLKPAVFGYHEVWHLYTIAASIAQFVGIWALAT
jgi:hemolysin III